MKLYLIPAILLFCHTLFALVESNDERALFAKVY